MFVLGGVIETGYKSHKILGKILCLDFNKIPDNAWILT